MSENTLFGPFGPAQTLITRLTNLGLIISILLLVAITLLVSGQVFLRNVFAMGLPWADELARWFGITLIYFTVPHLHSRGLHVSVDLLPSRFTGWARIVALLVAEMAVILFAVISLLAFRAFLERAAKFQTPALEMPNAVFYTPPLIGIALLALVAVLRSVLILRKGDAT